MHIPDGFLNTQTWVGAAALAAALVDLVPVLSLAEKA